MTYNKKIIQLPVVPGLWKFWDFGFQSGPNLIERWYQSEDLSDEARLTLDSLVKGWQKTNDHNQWIGFRHYMKGKLKPEKVWECGFLCDRKQYRILGKFGMGRKQAVLLIGYYHKQGVYTPRDALESAYKRSRALDRGEATLYEHKIRTDQ